MIHQDDETPIYQASVTQLIEELMRRDVVKCVGVSWICEGNVIKWAATWSDVEAAGLVVKEIIGSVEKAAGLTVDDVLDALGEDDDDAA